MMHGPINIKCPRLFTKSLLYTTATRYNGFTCVFLQLTNMNLTFVTEGNIRTSTVYIIFSAFTINAGTQDIA